MSDEPAVEDLEVTTAAQFKALGHPLRHRLLFALRPEPATMAQLAAALGAGKGNVAHHLGVLRDAGLVRVVETRQVRGGTEQYYGRTHRKLLFKDGDVGAGASVILKAVAAELNSATLTPLANVRNLRLTGEQAADLAREIGALIDGLTDAGPGEARYGVLAAVYRPRQPDPADPSA